MAFHDKSTISKSIAIKNSLLVDKVIDCITLSNMALGNLTMPCTAR